MTDNFINQKLKFIIKKGAIEWQKHSLQRMIERGISRIEVIDALLKGKRIEDYLSDQPFPSSLFLYLRQDKSPIHVVAAYDFINRNIFIITVYVPDLDHFESDFFTRRK